MSQSGGRGLLEIGEGVGLLQKPTCNIREGWSK